MTGPWRVIPGRPSKGGKPFWYVGRDEGGGIRFILTDYSRQPRKWFSEKAARDYCAITQAIYDEEARSVQRAAAQQAARAHLPPSWPFPVSFHNWSS